MDGRQTSPQSRTDAAHTLGEDRIPPRESREPLRRGDPLDRYVVLDRIGAGAMGLVYAAYDPKLDRRVALKLLHVRGPEVGTRRAQRLLREAQAMAQLTHPNVVTVHDVGTADGRVFLAMEYIEGQTLTRWLAEQPGWPRVLDVFVAAGRGLVAAHAKGLVHRDFKPDNVMLGTDGRVRVMDFGLARARDDASGDELPSRPGVDLSTQVTRTGALMGTPAYMAPEQHLGLALDARSDQFSFCVALYEGLYGVRPFSGESAAALGMAVTRGMLDDPPPGRTIPKWLRRVVLRGLRSSPDERFVDMSQLLQALQVDPGRRRRRLAWGAGALVLLSAGAWWNEWRGWSTPQAPPAGPCQGTDRHLRGVWDQGRQAALSQAMAASGSPMADATLSRVEQRLDRYTAQWVRMRTDNCEATRIRGEQSETLLDLRNACLDDRLRRVDDLVAVLERADAEVVQRAVSAVVALPSLGRCADVVALRNRLPPPDDPAVAEAVLGLREQIGQARARLHAGRYQEARALAISVRREAAGVGYRPALAEAHALEGEMLDETGDSAGAERALRQAYLTALQIRHDEVAAGAAAWLTYVVGYRLARHREGSVWGEHALAMGLRVGEGKLAEAQARHNLGALADATGDTEAAKEQYERSFALRARLLPQDHPDLARSLNALGNLHSRRAEYEKALARYRHALELREQIFGPGHPEVAGALNNVSIILRRQGKFEDSVQALRRAVEIYESVRGPDHPELAQSLDNLGVSLREGGDPAAAQAPHRRALEIRERVLGPEHPDLGDSLVGLGRALCDQGRHDEAEPLLRRALTLYEQGFGTDHPVVGSALIGLGVAQRGQGREATARAHFERATALLDDKAPGTNEAAEAHSLLEGSDIATGKPAPVSPPTD
ncbi:MAG: tetratricopeptide repeat protein [Myxococcota bacterium]